MKGIIWYKNKDKGISEYFRLIQKYEETGVFIAENHLGWGCIRFNNGDLWYLLEATENNRGRACNISLIDTEIDKKTIDTIIFPTIKSLPYRAYNYY